MFKSTFAGTLVGRCAALMLLAMIIVVNGHAQSWSPVRNVEIIHGSAPGGSNDKRAREVEKALAESKLIPASMTVVSKAGGGGSISMAYTNTHPGDGHYLLVAGSTMISNHIL